MTRTSYGLCALKSKLFHLVGLAPVWTFSFTPYTLVVSNGSSVIAEVSPQRRNPLFASKSPVRGLVLPWARTPAPMVPQASASSFPPKRTCALDPADGSVADHVTKRVPAPLATIEGLKSCEVALRKNEQFSSIVKASALTRYECGTGKELMRSVRTCQSFTGAPK